VEKLFVDNFLEFWYNSAMINKFLDPTNDIAFKKIFGNEQNKDILIRFINDMITFKERKPIVDLTFLQSEQNPEIATSKMSIVDVLCEDEVGNRYVVEMQVTNTRGFEKRAQYYAAKAYVNQMKKGERYEDLKEVIFLAIVDFVMFPDKEDYKSDHVILDKKTHDNDLKDFSFTFLELPKFKKDEKNLKNMVEKWTYFFKYTPEVEEQKINEAFKDDVIMMKAYEELDRFSWSKEEYELYEKVIKIKMDNAAAEEFVIMNAEKRGEARGIEKGIKEGEARGIEKGIKEGKIEIARKLKLMSMDFEEIAKATGLSLK